MFDRTQSFRPLIRASLPQPGIHLHSSPSNPGLHEHVLVVSKQRGKPVVKISKLLTIDLLKGVPFGVDVPPSLDVIKNLFVVPIEFNIQKSTPVGLFVGPPTNEGVIPDIDTI